MYCLKSHVKFIGYWKHVPIEIPKTYFSLPKRMLKWPKITMSQYRSLPWRGQTEWKMLTSSTQKYLATHEIDIQRFAQLMDCDLLTVCSLPVKPYICFRSIVQGFILYYPLKFWEMTKSNECNSRSIFSPTLYLTVIHSTSRIPHGAVDWYLLLLC